MEVAAAALATMAVQLTLVIIGFFVRKGSIRFSRGKPFSREVRPLS